MVTKTISWLLFGVFGYIWWWAGHGRDYINTEGNEWSRVFMLFTLVSLFLLILAPRATGVGMFDRLVGTMRTFIPKLPWLVLGIVAIRSVAWLTPGLMIRWTTLRMRSWPRW